MKTLIPADRIQQEVARLGARVATEHAGSPLTVLGVLTGSLVFLADLIRRIDVPLRVGLLQASSYRGAVTTPGELTVNEDLLPDLEGRDVLLVDDIYDTGRTLERVVQLVRARGPRRVRSAVAEHEVVEPFAMMDAKAKARHQPHREAHEVCLFDPQCIHQRNHIADQPVPAIGPIRHIRSPVAPVIVAQNAVLTGQKVDLVIPHRKV